MFRFVHAADVHLDSPLVGLDRYESAPVGSIRGATRRAFENLVQVAIDEEAAFVLLAGDLYDGDWKDYRTGLFFVAEMVKLREANIPVFIVAGNHDASSQLTKNLHPPDNVHFLSTRKPESRLVEGIGVAIHGQGFASRAVPENIAASYPVADPALFNIGLLHTSLDGREGHATYAPTSPQILAQRGYQYWALGHVHKREIVSKDPWIVFPGNLQGRHAREAGVKGCTIVTVDDVGVGSVEERAVDVVRWAVCHVDADGATTADDILGRILRDLTMEADRSDGRMLAVRVEVSGAVACHDEVAGDPDRWTQEVRSLAAGVTSTEVWVERVRFGTARPVDASAMGARSDALGSLLQELQAPADDPAEAAALRESLSDIRSMLPREVLDADGGFDPCNPQVLSQLIADARNLLLARIIRGETGP